ncbi:hypothetical protein LSAT2_025050 [Lamellibrachia satsuma]|nr:hypothetical protein LSAT2_025050 [Lamellibrachia satsuma]
MQETVRKYNMKALAIGNDLTSPHEFNLMFSTSIGPDGYLKGCLRGHMPKWRNMRSPAIRNFLPMSSRVWWTTLRDRHEYVSKPTLFERGEVVTVCTMPTNASALTASLETSATLLPRVRLILATTVAHALIPGRGRRVFVQITSPEDNVMKVSCAKESRVKISEPAEKQPVYGFVNASEVSLATAANTVSLIATVPVSEKKRMDVKLRLTNAIYEDTLKDKDSREYVRLRNHVEKASRKYRSHLPNRNAQRRSGPIDYCGGHQSNTMARSPDLKWIETPWRCQSPALQYRHRTKGFERRYNRVCDANVIRWWIIVGALVGLVLVGIAIGQTIYCLIKKSRRNSAAQHGNQNTQVVHGREEQTANRTSEMSNVYLTLQFDNPNFDGGDLTDNDYEMLGNTPVSHEQ